MEVNIAGALAPMLGTLQGQLEVKAQKTVLEIKEKLLEILDRQLKTQKKGLLSGANCTYLQEQGDRIVLSMEDLRKKRDGLLNFLEKASKKIGAIQKVLDALRTIITVAKAAILVLKLLPIPPAFIPISGILLVAADLLNFLQKLVEAVLKAITALTIILSGVLRVISLLIRILRSLDFAFKMLTDAITLLQGICSEEATPDQLRDSELLTEEGILTLTSLSQEILENIPSDFGSQVNAELLTGIDLEGDTRGTELVNRGIWIAQENYTGTEKMRDMVERLGKNYLCLDSHFSTEEGETGPPEDGYRYWKELGSKGKSTPEKGQSQPLSGALKDMIKEKSMRNPTVVDTSIESRVKDIYQKLSNSNISTDLKNQIELSLDLKEETPGEGIEMERDYISTNGKKYRMKIFRDEIYLYLAPRHYVNTYDDQGVLVLQGDVSFSSSTKILFEEMTFRIETQL